MIFRRVHDEFLQKCRENKFVHTELHFLRSLTSFHRFMVRDFNFSEDLLSKEREELDTADTTEKELWVWIST